MKTRGLFVLLIILSLLLPSCASSGKTELRGYEPPVQGLAWGDSADRIQNVLGTPAGSEASSGETSLTYTDKSLLGRKGTLVLKVADHGIGLWYAAFRTESDWGPYLQKLKKAYGECVKYQELTDSSGDRITKCYWTEKNLTALPEKEAERMRHFLLEVVNGGFHPTWEEESKKALVGIEVYGQTLIFDAKYQAYANLFSDDQAYETFMKLVE